MLGILLVCFAILKYFNGKISSIHRNLLQKCHADMRKDTFLSLSLDEKFVSTLLLIQVYIKLHFLGIYMGYENLLLRLWSH